MVPSRTAGRVVGLLLAAALLVPAATAASPSAPRLVAKPRIHTPDRLVLVRDGAGRQRLAVSVRAVYRAKTNVPAGLQSVHSVTARVELRTRTRLRSVFTRQRVILPLYRDGRAVGRTEYVLFSPTATRWVLRARAGARASAAGSLRLGIRATHRLVSPVTNKTVGSTSSLTSTPLPPVSSPRTQLGGTPGFDPCGRYSLGSKCINVQAWTWTAHHYWASHTQDGNCPSPPAGYRQYLFGGYTVDGGESGTHSFSDDSWENYNFSGASITVTDWNLSGHPYPYTVTIACTPSNSK